MTIYKSNNKYLFKNAYGINTIVCRGYHVANIIDNLHLDFLKKYRYIPKDSIVCANSREAYKIIS